LAKWCYDVAVLSAWRIVIGLIGILIAINIAIAATGNMHRGGHHPGWVDALSWLFAAIAWPLIVWGLVALVRRLRRRRAARHVLG
jgi:type VI protein secretion system component VasK